MTERPRLSRLVPGKADSDHVRRQNRALILSTLRRLAPIARVDLGAATRLSPATITAITADLIAEGLIETVQVEPGEAEDELPARRGRPRILLRLDPKASYVLGVKIAINQVTLVLGDFGGGIAARRDLTLSTLAETRETFPDRLAGLIRTFLDDEGVLLARIAELSIAAQGFVDTVAGSVMWSPAFRERDIRLVGPLRDRLGLN